MHQPITFDYLSAYGEQLGALIHHSDDQREVAYERHSMVGRLDKTLD
jgi:hypothetical protein